jgi:hypothetical protein
MQIDEGTNLCYLAKIPPLMGEYHSIWIGDNHIDHELTKTLMRDKMKFEDLSVNEQAKVLNQAKIDYPNAFKKLFKPQLKDKEYQKWLQQQAIKATVNEMYNQEEEVA